MQESLTTEHSSELLADALEELLYGSAVTNKGGGHLETTGRDVTNGSLDVVRDPLDKVRAVLVLDVQHLFVDLLHGHASTEHGGDGEVASMTWVTGGHHVFGVKHLLSELGDGEGTVLLRPTTSERSETGHEEMKTWEWDHVHSKFTQVSIELARETEASGNAAHRSGDEMIQITVSWSGELQSTEANIIKSLVIDAKGLVSVLDKLMNRERSIVGLNDSIGYFRRRNDAKGVHDSIGILLADLGNEEGTHPRAGPAPKGVGELKALEAVAALGFFPNNV